MTKFISHFVCIDITPRPLGVFVNAGGIHQSYLCTEQSDFCLWGTCIRNIFQYIVSKSFDTELLATLGSSSFCASVEKWRRELDTDKENYSVKSITVDETEFQSAQRWHVQPWDLRQRCSL